MMGKTAADWHDIAWSDMADMDWKVRSGQMREDEIRDIIERQRAYFSSGATLEVKDRAEALGKLKACVKRHEREIGAALRKDLGKSMTESYMCETGLVLSEITYMLKHMKSYAKEQTVRTPLAQFCSRSYKKPSPYGTVLIMSPWNYPFLLSMEPLVDAIAAGNTAVVKPSAYSPHTSAVVEKIIGECFEKSYVAVVTGGREENTCLLNEKFDYIFFTGSQAVGKEVLRHAAERLTPVTLELGGKSPCVVEKSADIPMAARRIVFGKFLNCGQTCVAPDYVYCDRAVKDELIGEMKREIRKQFGREPLRNGAYGRIVNEKHFRRLLGVLGAAAPGKVVYGGGFDEKTLKIEPTILDNVTFQDAIMKEEIFGPLLPVLTYDTFDGAIENIRSLPHPLALYIFTSNRAAAEKIMSRCGFGGGCINDTVIHLATSEMGFGGFGESGMGAYHGKAGFDTFTHYKSIVNKHPHPDLPMRYQPYKRLYDRLVHVFLR